MGFTSVQFIQTSQLTMESRLFRHINDKINYGYGWWRGGGFNAVNVLFMPELFEAQFLNLINIGHLFAVFSLS